MAERWKRTDRVWVDGLPYLIEKTGMYAGTVSGFGSTRPEGVTVRPLGGGRAKVVAVSRLMAADAPQAPPWPESTDG